MVPSLKLSKNTLFNWFYVGGFSQSKSSFLRAMSTKKAQSAVFLILKPNFLCSVILTVLKLSYSCDNLRFPSDPYPFNSSQNCLVSG